MNDNWPNRPDDNKQASDETPTESMWQAAPPPPPPTQSGAEQSSPQQPQQTAAANKTRGFGWPGLTAGIVLAAVLGGGAGGLAVNYFGTNDVTASEDVQDSPQLNRTDDVTATTEAAAVASPSVVTLSVGGDQALGAGSGVILDEQGHILTNNHVVTLGGQTADAGIQVQTSDGYVHDAEVVGLDPMSDLAVIRIDAEGLTPIEMGSVDNLNVGDQAVAIGAPLGLAGTVTEGIISTLDRTISVASSEIPEEPETPPSESPFEFGLPEDLDVPAQQGQIHLNVIQSDAAINPGNSGGALVDQEGRLVGINVAIASQTEGNVGLGFAIPVDYAQRIAQDIIEHGEATHGMLGVSIVPAEEGEIAAGARVVEVVEPGPAADSNLQPDDVIVGIDDDTVADPNSLSATVSEYPAGAEVELTVVRDGEEFTETIELGSME